MEGGLHSVYPFSSMIFFLFLWYFDCEKYHSANFMVTENLINPLPSLENNRKGIPLFYFCFRQALYLLG